jgi:hypothetical protein
MHKTSCLHYRRDTRNDKNESGAHVDFVPNDYVLMYYY